MVQINERFLKNAGGILNGTAIADNKRLNLAGKSTIDFVDYNAVIRQQGIYKTLIRMYLRTIQGFKLFVRNKIFKTG